MSWTRMVLAHMASSIGLLACVADVPIGHGAPETDGGGLGASDAGSGMMRPSDAAPAREAAASGDSGKGGSEGGSGGNGGPCAPPSYPAGFTLCGSGNLTSEQATAGCGPVTWDGTMLGPFGASACGSTTITSGHWELWCDAVTDPDAGPSRTAYLFAELNGITQTATTTCAGSIPELTSADIQYDDGTEQNTYAGGNSNFASNANDSPSWHLAPTGCVTGGPFLVAAVGTGNVWVAGWLNQPAGTPEPQCTPVATPDDGGGSSAVVLLGFDFAWQ